jgi:hypothetical protein
MHSTVRAIIASIVSGIVGWLSVAIGDGLYRAAHHGLSVPTSSDYTIFNWTISLILSGVVFIYIYIKVADWLGE